MTFDPNLTAKQAETLRRAREAKIAIWEGSVRSSKTVVSIIAFVEHLVNGPEGAMLMAGRTTDTLRRNVIDPMIQMFGSANIQPVYGSGKAIMFGRTVHLVGVDNAAAESRIRGITLAGAYVDEVSVLAAGKGEEWWNQLIARCSIPGSKIFGTTNPGGPTHWLLNSLERCQLEVTQDGRVVKYSDAGKPEPRLPGFHRYRFTLRDNPTLTEEYVRGLEAYYQGVFYDRNVLGLWVQAEGAIYPIDRNTHVVPTPTFSGTTEWVVGIDHGMTNDTSAVLLAIDRTNQRLVVCSECRVDGGNDKTVRQQVEQITAWIKEGCGGILPNYMRDPDDLSIVCDPAARAFRNEWHAASYRFPKPANNKVLDGISETLSLLGSGRLYFTEETVDTQLWKELTGYRWADGKDQPIKEADHGPDALRYAVMSCAARWRPWQETVKPKEPVDRVFHGMAPSDETW